MIELLYLAGALVFASGTMVYDVVMSEKGLAKGVAVEANFTWLYGTTKPKAWQYYAVNIPIILLASALSVVGLATHNPAMAYAGLVGPCIVGVKHILAGLQWRKLGVKW